MNRRKVWVYGVPPFFPPFFFPRPPNFFLPIYPLLRYPAKRRKDSCYPSDRCIGFHRLTLKSQ